MAITQDTYGRIRYARNPRRGIALLVTVIFMSVMLAFGLALASLAYKQSVLASTAVQSQTAFYAADAALECALYADQQQGAFIYSDYDASHVPDLSIIPTDCDGTMVGAGTSQWDATRLTVSERISFNGGKNCADITVYKYAAPLADGRKAFTFSMGYNVACGAVGSAGGRIVARGINEQY